MKKEYIKPEVELVSLMATESITDNEEGLLDGELGLESSEFD